ncbi:hypothetical protein CTA1_1127 [Colletotrichum tanaceti]|uniref:Uncharacterized protein n=1 Tax=Colletotrichum tanaceti TaxID=1306861 RepID=A0A4U6XH98_9PEZI|nr:hypothetical protein CTA1_1127 [Colletotrichum tanaceti]
MAPQVNRKGFSTKATKETGVEAGVQGQTHFEEASAIPAVKKMKAAKTTDSEVKDKAESDNEEGEESEEEKKSEEGKETKQAKSDAPTFLTFLSRLPREIGAMIIELAATTEPAIAYGTCRLNTGAMMLPVVNTGAEGSLSKFKKLVCLGKRFPDFKRNIERGSGIPLSNALATDPRLGIRKDMDLMVFLFDKKDLASFSWVSRSQREINRVMLAPGILNVGVYYDIRNRKGLTCNFCASCVYGSYPESLCPRQLAIFAQNLSDVHSIFILVRLRPSDVVGTSRSKHIRLMKKLVADTKDVPRHMSFKDSERTWVEVSHRSPPGTKNLIDSGVLSCVLRLRQTAFKANNKQIAAIVGRNARRNIRFRVLLGSYWRDATLGI